MNKTQFDWSEPMSLEEFWKTPEGKDVGTTPVGPWDFNKSLSFEEEDE